MEDLIAKILKDSSPSKHALLRKSCLETQEFLESQHELMRSPPYELRKQCLATLKLALESKHSKLVSHALNGFQRLIWDKSFQSAFESDDEESWLPCQLLNAVYSLPSHQEDVQVEVLKILLQMTGTEGHSFSARSVIQLISLCLEVYSAGSAAVRTAAQAAANQSLQTFCSSLQEIENEEDLQNDDEEYDKGIGSVIEVVIEDMEPVLAFICEKLKGFMSPPGKLVTPLLLQCIFSILTNLKGEVHLSNTFLNFVWQQLCPQLVAMLGSPKTDKNIVSNQKSVSTDGSEVGRGSGCLTVAPSCQSSEAKTIYSIAVELVRLVGSVGSLRPVLESLFHRMLLYPPPQHRLEALKALKDLMNKTEYLLNFAAPPLYLANDKSSRSADLDLIRIAMDSLGECCHSSDNGVCYASVSCVVVLLRSLETLCSGANVSEAYVKLLNDLFKTLESSDYKGVKSERWLETRLQCQNSPIPRRKKYVKKTFPENIPNVADNNLNTCMTLYPDSSSSDSGESDAELEQNGVEIDEGQENRFHSDQVDESVVSDLHCHSPCETEDKLHSCVSYDVNVETSQETGIDDASELPENRNNSPEHIACNVEENCDEVRIEQDPQVNENEPVIEAAVEVVPCSASSAASERHSEAGGDEEILSALEEHERELAEKEADRRKKVPRTLLGQEDAGKKERERVERLCEARLEFAQQERQNARQFVKELLRFLPKLLAIRSSIEADQALQEFASSYCEGMWKSQQDSNNSAKNSSLDDTLSHITIMNADGIYLAMYSALLLNLKLIRNKYYSDPSQHVPLTEHLFIEEVHGSGVLVYLSATWLAELYQQVLASNLLETAGYCPGSLENSAVINLLSGLEQGVDGTCVVTISDVDGLGNSLPGGQQLADYRRLERAVANIQSSPSVEAGMKFARRILTSSWETILEVLSVLLNGTNSCGISSTLGFLLGTEGAKEEHRKAKDAIAESLDGLQMAAKLCNALGLQARSSAVFAQLAAASCPLPEDSYLGQASSPKLERRLILRKSLLPSRNKSLRLHTSQILSMDAILNRGLELGSHSSDCWKYVFQCCMYVLDLERTYFSDHSGTSTVLSRPPLLANNSSDRKGSGDDLLFISSFDSTKSTFMDMLPMPGKSLSQKLNINEIIKQNGTVTNSSGIVKDRQLLEIIEVLSQSVDRLFEEAASRLNLSALIGFLVELCAASQIQLFNKSLDRFLSSDCHGNSLLLYHLGDIMLRCARGGRPLIHVMKSWSVVAPHFVEAACHKDRVISKKAITIIHDIVSALLSSNSELPHFHFNEALFKPFENLLCLELCDADVQEQIVSSICEFVEGCTIDIRSGWRPLFGALRAVRISGFSSSVPSLEFEREQSHHLRVVLDVFEAFLGTNNILVFAYAVVDCLLCLLKHVRGPADIQDTLEEQSLESLEKPVVPFDMCLAALKYLERCAAILSSMYSMPSCPIFNSANRIQIHTEPNLVDPNIPGMDVIYFSDQNGHFDFDYASNGQSCDGEKNYSLYYKQLTSLKSLDKSTGVLHVWFLLLEGLAGAMATCPKRYQPHTMESLFCMLRNIKDVPGPSFGVFCVNHLLLPMLQNWLRRTTTVPQGWDNFAANFKQCCGFATDLVVDYIQCMSDTIKEESHQTDDVKLMLQQLFVVLTECIAQPTEIISRLGCACIKHTVMTAGNSFTCDLWGIVCSNIQRACRVSLHNAKQLMVCFHPDSDNFYGDLGEVQVAARRDCTPQESERLKQLAHQVFLLDCQRNKIYPAKSDTTPQQEERSFTFLLHPPDQEKNDNCEMNVVRIPFHSLVVGLLSHQILLQTLGTILLQGTCHLLPSLMTLLPSLTMGNGSSSSSEKKTQLPGFLSKLQPSHIKILLSCLEESYKVAYEFDCRPGLKFLIEKVAETDVAANLYKQAAISWTTHMLVLFEICLERKNISSELGPEVQDRQKHSALNSPSTIADSRKIGDSEQCSVEEILDGNYNSEFDWNGMVMNYSFNLQEKFRDLCETYIELILDRDGTLAVVDRMTDQPIFFLIASPEETNDFTFCSRRTKEVPLLPDYNDELQGDTMKEYHSGDSDSEDLVTSLENSDKDKIYRVATEQTINTLIGEFKRRKVRHTMPSTLREKLRRRSNASDKGKNTSNNSVTKEIDDQKKASVMKDGEAHLQVWKQLIQCVFDLHHSLSDKEFYAFIPIFFPGVECLVAYGTDNDLKLALADWLHRLVLCCGFPMNTNLVSSRG